MLEALPAGATTDQMEALAGDADERVGDFGKALSHFQAAAQKNPSDANLYALTTELLRPLDLGRGNRGRRFWCEEVSGEHAL